MIKMHSFYATIEAVRLFRRPARDDYVIDIGLSGGLVPQGGGQKIKISVFEQRELSPTVSY